MALEQKNILLISLMMLGMLLPASRGFSAEPVTPLVLESTNVCELLTGESIANLLSAKFVESKSYSDRTGPSARCAYFLILKDAAENKQSAFVVWLLPETKFAEMRPYLEEKPTDIKELGDGAYMVFHEDSKRFDLMVLKKGRAAIEITGENDATIRNIAELALSKL